MNIEIGKKYVIDRNLPKACYSCCKLANFWPFIDGQTITITKADKQEGWYKFVFEDGTDLYGGSINKYALKELSSQSLQSKEEQVLSMVKTIGEMADTMDTMGEQSLQSKEEKKEEGDDNE